MSQLLLLPFLPQTLKHLDNHPLLFAPLWHLSGTGETKVWPSTLELVSKAVKQRTKITALHLLAVPLSLQHQMLLAFTAASPRVAPVQLFHVPHSHFHRAAAREGSAYRGLFLAPPRYHCINPCLLNGKIKQLREKFKYTLQCIKTLSTEEHHISKLTDSAAERSELYQHWQY